jgi:fatty acid desaturase
MLQLSLEKMSRYVSPVNPSVYPHLSVVLLAIGIFFTAWFFVYEVTSTKFTREMMKEILISIIASIFMGLGTLFLLLWVGIYV